MVKDSSDEDEDDVLPIGTTFEKRFPGYGNELWEGTIVRYDPKNQKPYQGEYTRDGFLDWYTYAELMKCKVKLPSAVREESEEEEEEEEGIEEEKEEEEEEEEEEEVVGRGQRKGKKRKATTTAATPSSKQMKKEPEVQLLLNRYEDEAEGGGGGEVADHQPVQTLTLMEKVSKIVHELDIDSSMTIAQKILAANKEMDFEGTGTKMQQVNKLWVDLGF